jgi:hypothetical protein
MVLPSSHCSPTSTFPSPQAGVLVGVGVEVGVSVGVSVGVNVGVTVGVEVGVEVGPHAFTTQALLYTALQAGGHMPRTGSAQAPGH